VLGRADAEPLPPVLHDDLRQAHRDRRRQLLERRRVRAGVVQVQLAVVVGGVRARVRQAQQLVQPVDDLLLGIGEGDLTDQLRGLADLAGVAAAQGQRRPGREPLLVRCEKGLRAVQLGVRQVDGQFDGT
jgi:hypothetical protein